MDIFTLKYLSYRNDGFSLEIICNETPEIVEELGLQWKYQAMKSWTIPHQYSDDTKKTYTTPMIELFALPVLQILTKKLSKQLLGRTRHNRKFRYKNRYITQTPGYTLNTE